MDGASADSDHSMTWEDFFGSTTDLAPTLIELYDSLLDKTPLKPDANTFETAKDARNDPPLTNKPSIIMTESTNEDKTTDTLTTSKHLSNIRTSVKLPVATVNKSSLYSIRTKSDYKGASNEIIREINTSEVTDPNQNRTFKDLKQNDNSTFDNFSPNVKRMLSSANETTTLKFQKKTANPVRSSTRHKSNIPLMGATSKISQSGVDILTTVDIYDQPCVAKNFNKSKAEDTEMLPKPLPPKVEFKLNHSVETYDVPTNNRPIIYDVPNQNSKTAFDQLSLPYIDQSIELSSSSNDREFDTKVSPYKPESKSNSPEGSPGKFQKTVRTNSLNSKQPNKDDSPSKRLMKSVPYPNTVASTGDLKSAISEKEVVRLNPQTAEVPRPLSMSSIASSSSTSSSGGQNKGVNSAYLASIESLDDQSDADLTSANSSNNLDKSDKRPTVMFPPRQHLEDELSGLSPLERVCAEIIQTENVYVEDLRQVIEGYLHVWRREATFSEEELAELFNNIEDIYAFNRSLCDELNTCQLDASCIARCFVNNTDGFTVYTSYCTGYPRTMSRLARLAGAAGSARQFRERQAALHHALPLASFLLKPVQRLLKYHLLLQNVVKQCASRDTQFALLKMTGIAQHIDDMKRRHEHAVRVQEIQSLLYGWNGPDLTTYGELCAEGTFRVFGAKAMRHLFLFDKLLLVTKNREDGILAYKMSIMCNNMMLVESLAGAPLSFQVIAWDAPRDQLTLQAASPRHKREWTLLLKRVILENYNAVIPSHARQLVMELGQNKTDDDILAEKSHNLITQASMRKQLSAPEYLEKRKLERERRKTCENNLRGTFKKNRKLTVPLKIDTTNDCDCTQYSADKGVDYTCDNCYVDLCSDCETEISNKNKRKEYTCKHDDNYDVTEKCPDCDKALHYIDSGSTEQIERRPSICKCSDFKSSQESFSKDQNNSLNKTRGYHSSDNIIGYVEKSNEVTTESNNSMSNIRNIPKTCLKCEKIKENIVVTDTPTRKSRCADNPKSRIDNMRSKSKDDPQRSKLSVISTWRRKSEPGLQQNCPHQRKPLDSDSEKGEKIEFECRNCGSTKISRKHKHSEGLLSDPESEKCKSNVEVRKYTTKNIPKKISKMRRNRAKRLGCDVTAKFYTDLSTDVSTENILHISESNDSLNIDQTDAAAKPLQAPEPISKDDDIDEETYQKLIEKTDSFKKNELEKVKFLNKQKVIKEGSETEDKSCFKQEHDNVSESCEETEQPLEHIISQLLLQNRDFQMLLKKQQQRHSSHRRHQRLLKSHSTPEPVKGIEERANGKFSRQSLLDNTNFHNNTIETRLEPPEEYISEEDHIYETLRVEPKDDHLHNLDSKSKTIQHTQIARPKRLSTPPNAIKAPDIITHLPKNRIHVSESDYVYLSFEKLNQIKIEDTVYDVPVQLKGKSEQRKSETQYYEEMQHQGPPESPTAENVYDNIVEVCRRSKETPKTLPTEYLPMSPGDQHSPNAPEIWVNRQKEHFTVSRDRKSGSLPRSFQVPVSSPDDNSLSTFKCKPQTNSKTYLNRDGKVLNSDRPFTIASDQSEISYDDIENYMSERDVLKFNKSPTAKDGNFSQELTKSTLELEEEIDRCYKNNFEQINLAEDKNKNITTSNSNLTTSVNSSCEEHNEDQTKDDVIVHPEHKIYKPTSNLLSLKNVLSRFKNRNPKNTEESEINANDQSSPDSAKSDIKSPTSEKRSVLNPRNYSKNLLQRFRSIIGDDQPDDNHNKITTVKSIDIKEVPLKNEIKVVITSTDASPTTSTIVYTINTDSLSKSVFGNTTLTDSQHEKSKLENLSYSCDNITNNKDIIRPTYAKSHSLTTSTLKEVPASPSRSNSCKQSLNDLPMYMLGSKNLGARIASTEYADPVALEKSPIKNVNKFINKNSVRPDSLFSISSFVTSSSEGTSQDSSRSKNDKLKENLPDITGKHEKTNDNYYEIKFEKIEQFKDEIFRDSAVYSDQDESEESKSENNKRKVSEIVAKVENIQRNSSFNVQKEKVTSVNQNKVSIIKDKTMVTIKTSTANSEKKVDDVIVKPKIAPPVPVKPRVTQIPTTITTNARPSSTRTGNKVIVRPTNITKENNSSNESVNTKLVHKATSLRIPKRNESTLTKRKVQVEKMSNNTESVAIEETSNEIKPGNIQIKRLSFERASLDSATRRIKTITETKRASTQETKTTMKSVMERRMEIEKMSKKDPLKPTVPSKKPSPLLITKPIKSLDRSGSENGGIDAKPVQRCNPEAPSIPSTSDSFPNDTAADLNSNMDLKESWVKQVVNKFQ